jgi:hypothetical protein
MKNSLEIGTLKISRCGAHIGTPKYSVVSDPFAAPVWHLQMLSLHNRRFVSDPLLGTLAESGVLDAKC